MQNQTQASDSFFAQTEPSVFVGAAGAVANLMKLELMKAGIQFSSHQFQASTPDRNHDFVEEFCIFTFVRELTKAQPNPQCPLGTSGSIQSLRVVSFEDQRTNVRHYRFGKVTMLMPLKTRSHMIWTVRFCLSIKPLKQLPGGRMQLGHNLLICNKLDFDMYEDSPCPCVQACRGGFMS
jgi:hypothetical protein